MHTHGHIVKVFQFLTFSLKLPTIKIFTKLKPFVYFSLDPGPIHSFPDPEFVLTFHVSYIKHIKLCFHTFNIFFCSCSKH